MSHGYTEDELDDEVFGLEDDGEDEDGEDEVDPAVAEQLMAEAEQKAREAGF